MVNKWVYAAFIAALVLFLSGCGEAAPRIGTPESQLTGIVESDSGSWEGMTIYAVDDGSVVVTKDGSVAALAVPKAEGRANPAGLIGTDAKLIEYAESPDLSCLVLRYRQPDGAEGIVYVPCDGDYIAAGDMKHYLYAFTLLILLSERA